MDTYYYDDEDYSSSLRETAVIAIIIMLILISPFLAVAGGMLGKWSVDKPQSAMGGAGFVCGFLLAAGVFSLLLGTGAIGYATGTALGVLFMLYLTGGVLAAIAKNNPRSRLTATILCAGPMYIIGNVVLLLVLLLLCFVLDEIVRNGILLVVGVFGPLVVLLLTLGFGSIKSRAFSSSDQQQLQGTRHFVLCVCCWGGLALVIGLEAIAQLIVAIASPDLWLSVAFLVIILLLSALLGRHTFVTQTRRLTSIPQWTEAEGATPTALVYVETQK